MILFAQWRDEHHDQKDDQRPRPGRPNATENPYYSGIRFWPNDSGVDQRRRNRDQHSAETEHQPEPQSAPRPAQPQVGAGAVAAEPGDEDGQPGGDHRGGG